MKLSYKDTLFATTSKHQSLDDIINDIKNGVYKDVVDEIRTVDKDKRKKLKHKLPAFFVDVVLDVAATSANKSKKVSSTGIIQFDLDDYDVDKSKQTIKRINEHPSTLYSFLSPSGGIKFGVMTDFDCKDKNTIGHKHKIAYDIVVDEIEDLLKGYEVDKATERVYQTCLLSYDDNAYLNKSVDKLKINKQANDLFDEEEKQRQSLSTHITTTDDKEVLDALKSIPNNLRYNERLPINFAVIDYFGQRAKQILLGYWSKQDKKKLEGQIDSQIKSHLAKTGSKITINTLSR
jgi:hypothetical protein